MSSLSSHFIGTATRPHPIRALASATAETDAQEWLDNLRLFATGWMAGLIFFGTFLA
jgi:hypothetical protein